MSNWWDVQNTSPLAYQPNTQFALPSWDADANQMPISPNLIPVAGGIPGVTGAQAPTNGVGLNASNLWGALGNTDARGNRTDGWGGMALGVGQGLAGAFMGAKQYQLAQDALKENKRQFSLNFENQRKTVNTELQDRQRARVASNPGAYQSVSEYMKQNGV